MLVAFFLLFIFCNSYTAQSNTLFDALWEDAERQLAQICITNEMPIDMSEEATIAAKKKMLKKAIKHDDGHQVERLLKEGTPLMMKGLLQYAIDHDSTRSLQILLRHGADVNQRYRNRYPLGCALQWCDDIMASLLLDAGAEPELIDKQGNTALHIACKKGSLTLVERLVDRHRASLVARNHNQMTPLHCAAEGGEVDTIVTLLCKGSPYEVRDHMGATPLMVAIAQNHHAAALALLTAKACVTAQDNNGNTPLHYAVASDTLMVHALLDHYADGHTKNKKGNNPLHVLIAQQPLPQEYDQMISLLADTHDLIDEPNGMGETPLLIALFCNHADVAQILLRKGANPNIGVDPCKPMPAHTIWGHMPLHVAVNKGLCKIVSLLLEKGANPFVAMPSGQLPLHSAKKHRIRKFLRDAMQKWSSASSVASSYEEIH